jgi:geranylgeranyl pyrophosphate synthase
VNPNRDSSSFQAENKRCHKIPRKDTGAIREKSSTNPGSREPRNPRQVLAMSRDQMVATPSASSFLETDKVQARRSLIDREIQRYLRSDKGEPAILYEAAHHLVTAGGKRLRSLMTLLCCEAVGGDIEKALPVALAEELLQTASLIHDDILDDGKMRRGVQTVHCKFGRDMAILAGDLLILQAIRILGERATPRVVARIGAGGIRVCEGEAADLQISADRPKTLDGRQYFEMIARKTAAFLKDSASVGALAGDATQEQEQALSHYGEMLGYAFQLRDDILDVEGSSDTAEKTTRADLRLKRGNYLLIRTQEAGSERQWRQCQRALEHGDLDTVVAIVKEVALAHAYELARSYVAQAKQALQGHGFRTQELLERVADFTVTRTF